MSERDNITVHVGDCRKILKTLPDASVQCCVTSPPYYGLRDYGHEGQIGQEKTVYDFIEAMVEVFREVRRILKPDGVLWLNLGDSYARNPSRGVKFQGGNTAVKDRQTEEGNRGPAIPMGLKEKDLIGVPWRVAFALQADGWYLRSDVIWNKANCMPESVTDRPTRSHEYMFLMSKNAQYFYDHEAIKEPCIYDVDGTGTAARKARAEGNKLVPTEKVNGIRPGGYKNSVNFDGKNKGAEKQRGHSRRHDGFNGRWDEAEEAGEVTGMRNKRDVWTVAPANYPEAHFATYPPDLIKPCILAGSKPGDVVLDPFGGSGTTGMVALELGRKAVLIELNPEYAELIDKRTDITPGLGL